MARELDWAVFEKAVEITASAVRGAMGGAESQPAAYAGDVFREVWSALKQAADDWAKRERQLVDQVTATQERAQMGLHRVGARATQLLMRLDQARQEGADEDEWTVLWDEVDALLSARVVDRG